MTRISLLAASFLLLLACSDETSTAETGATSSGAGATSSASGGSGGVATGGSGGVATSAGGGGSGGTSTGGGAGGCGTGGNARFPSLPACGGFTDDFSAFDLADPTWEGQSAVSAGTPADPCVEISTANAARYGDIYTETYYPIHDCFTSVRIDQPSDATMGILVTAIDDATMQISGQFYINVLAGTAEAWIEEMGQAPVLVGTFTGDVTAMRIRFTDEVRFDVESCGTWTSFGSTPEPVWADTGKIEVGVAGQGTPACFDDVNLDAP